MSRSATEILKEALHLDERERARVAGALLESLHEPAEPGAAEAWERAMERRAREPAPGTAETVGRQSAAKREPTVAADTEAADRLTRLARQGLIRRASQSAGRALHGPPPPRPPAGASVLEALLDERHGGR